MPKKKNGGGASTRLTPNPDESYIVFSNAKDKPENKDAGEPRKQPNATNGAQQGAVGEAQKRADTRTLIGGASWTGKLPVNMLAEHCQKQRWEKPEYTMVRSLWSTPLYISDIPASYRARLPKDTPRW